MKAVVAAFNQEKALVGAFSVITNLRLELFEALLSTEHFPPRLKPGPFCSCNQFYYDSLHRPQSRHGRAELGQDQLRAREAAQSQGYLSGDPIPIPAQNSLDCLLEPDQFPAVKTKSNSLPKSAFSNIQLRVQEIRDQLEVSCDWWSAGHVTPVLTSDWSPGPQAELCRQRVQGAAAGAAPHPAPGPRPRLGLPRPRPRPRPGLLHARGARQPSVRHAARRHGGGQAEAAARVPQ